jgi:hypothetical protein
MCDGVLGKEVAVGSPAAGESVDDLTSRTIIRDEHGQPDSAYSLPLH